MEQGNLRRKLDCQIVFKLFFTVELMAMKEEMEIRKMTGIENLKNEYKCNKLEDNLFRKI